MVNKILLVEDSIDCQNLVEKILRPEYETVTVSTLSEARSHLQTGKFSLVLLDIELPDGLGYDLCESILQLPKPPPIIFLTGRTGPDERIHGFAIGADDYIEKPFDPKELKIRIINKIKKVEVRQAHQARISDEHLELDLSLLKGYLRDSEKKTDMNLTPIEFKLLSLLMENPEQHYSRDRLIEILWPDSPHMAARGVDTHISHLRKKLGLKADLIQSTYGKGYFYDYGLGTAKVTS